jgi:hypothetical protein
MTRSTAIAIVIIAVAAALAPIPAGFVERWYSSLLYPLLQRVMTPLSNLVPFALFDIVCLWAIAATAVLVYRRVRARGWSRGIVSVGAVVVVAAAIVYLAFLAMWGLNYRRVPLRDKLLVDRDRINRAAARDLGAQNAAALNRLYAASHPAVIDTASLASSFEQSVRQLGGRAVVVPGRPKQTLLGGYFHQISTRPRSTARRSR